MLAGGTLEVGVVELEGCLIKASGSDKQEGNDLLFHLSRARVSKSKFQSREGTRQNLKEGKSQVAF